MLAKWVTAKPHHLSHQDAQLKCSGNGSLTRKSTSLAAVPTTTPTKAQQAHQAFSKKRSDSKTTQHIKGKKFLRYESSQTMPGLYIK